MLLFERFDWPAPHIGYFMSVGATSLGVAVLCLMPWLSKNFHLDAIVKGSILALMVCVLLFPLVRNSEWLWLLNLLTMAVPFAYVGMTTLLSNAVSANEQGKIMGVLGSFAALAWAIAPMVTGYLVKSGLIESYLLAFLLLGITYYLFYVHTRSVKLTAT